MRLAYLVHDLADPAVARRLAMLAPHLASAIVIGCDSRHLRATACRSTRWLLVHTSAHM